ncbi:hypothetical protein LTR55_007293 [Exophiala xenobiotica]|nr:hypothetical protein LTR55_007293 [Exophiala xenobiotica]
MAISNDVPPDESRLARIITTVDDAQNGFRNELLPIALSHKTKASQGLMESILALCAFHVGGPSQALQHKARALRLLHQALQTDHPDDLSAKLATCMLLCVYGVFDTTDGNWKIHLKGAKTLVQSPSEAGHDIDSRQGVSSFLRSWMLYHDVLAQFSQTLPGSGSRAPVTLPASSEEKTTLRDQMIRDQNVVDEVQHRLENLSQSIVIQLDQNCPSSSGNIDEVRIQDTAKFYHLAALIYFRRQVLRIPPQSRPIQSLVESALALIARMEICTSPWPLFVVACEVRTDEQRLHILQTLKKMELHRRIGNIGVTRAIVEALWKQQDLAPDDASKASTDWRTIVNMDDMAPSFI